MHTAQAGGKKRVHESVEYTSRAHQQYVNVESLGDASTAVKSHPTGLNQGLRCRTRP